MNFYLFADDTNIYYESSSLKDLEKTINKELGKLYLWLNVNRLSLNIDKPNFTVFHPYNKPLKQYITIKINKIAIEEKHSIKYLGVLVDSSLNWKDQISNITKKISRAIGILYKLRLFLPINVMKNIYYSLIYSHIIYAIEVWGSAFKTELDKILILQKRAIRLMTFNDAYPITPGPLRPSDPIFTKLNFLKVEDIFKFQVSKFVFMCLYGNTPLQFHNWFTLNYEKYGHRTRSNYNTNNGIFIKSLFVPSARTTNYGLKQLRVTGPRIWNALPTYIKNEISFNVFLKNLKVHYISGYA